MSTSRAWFTQSSQGPRVRVRSQRAMACSGIVNFSRPTGVAAPRDIDCGNAQSSILPVDLLDCRGAVDGAVLRQRRRWWASQRRRTSQQWNTATELRRRASLGKSWRHVQGRLGFVAQGWRVQEPEDRRSLRQAQVETALFASLFPPRADRAALTRCPSATSTRFRSKSSVTSSGSREPRTPCTCARGTAGSPPGWSAPVRTCGARWRSPFATEARRLTSARGT